MILPGDMWIQGDRTHVVVALYKRDWSSLLITPPKVDAAVVLETDPQRTYVRDIDLMVLTDWLKTQQVSIRRTAV